MVMCFAPDCKHYSEQKICKFFVFPAAEVERRKWIALIRRQDREPTKYSLVCSCHFVNGARENGPTIFEHNAKRKFLFTSPEKRKRVNKAVLGEEAVLGEDAILGESSASASNTSNLDDPVAGPSTHSDDPNVFADTENVPSCSKTDVLLDAENYFLTQELEQVTEKFKKFTTRFSYEHIKNNDLHVLMYTGIPSSDLFMILYETMECFSLKYYAGWNVKLMSKIDQLLMTLMKLRLNLPHEDLAIRFSCSTATVTNVVMTWIYALHEVLFKQLMATIPSRQKNQACLPAAFACFRNCKIILDCTEIYSAIPASMENQRLTYSSYKHRNTWKILVGVAPNGVITFVSKAYPGSISDKKIVEHSDILKQMIPGDLILADKGFLIKDLLPAGVSLNIPPFLSTPQFTESQVYETQQIAKARIHVERAIRRIKCFHILNQVPSFYISQISTIFQLCAAITNFQYPLIKEVEEYYC